MLRVLDALGGRQKSAHCGTKQHDAENSMDQAGDSRGLGQLGEEGHGSGEETGSQSGRTVVVRSTCKSQVGVGGACA